MELSGDFPEWNCVTLAQVVWDYRSIRPNISTTGQATKRTFLADAAADACSEGTLGRPSEMAIAGCDALSQHVGGTMFLEHENGLFHWRPSTSQTGQCLGSRSRAMSEKSHRLGRK